MKRTDVKSHCPINYATEIFGDNWSLLIVRDIVFWGKHTFSEFLGSQERIATNVLTDRLNSLKNAGIIRAVPDSDDRRRDKYFLTSKGLDVMPFLLEIAEWSARYDAETNAPASFMAALRADRAHTIELAYKILRRGGAIFVGPNSITP